MKLAKTKNLRTLFASAAASVLMGVTAQAVVIADYSGDVNLSVYPTLTRSGYTGLEFYYGNGNRSRLYHDIFLSPTPYSWANLPNNSVGWSVGARYKFDPAPGYVEGFSFARNSGGTGFCSCYNLGANGGIQWGLNRSFAGWNCYGMWESNDGGWWVVWASNTANVTYVVWKIGANGQLAMSKGYGPFTSGTWSVNDINTTGSAVRLGFARPSAGAKYNKTVLTIDASGIEFWGNEIISKN